MMILMLTLMQKYTVQKCQQANIYNHCVSSYNETTSSKITTNTPGENIVVNHKKNKMLMHLLTLVCWRQNE